VEPETYGYEVVNPADAITCASLATRGLLRTGALLLMRSYAGQDVFVNTSNCRAQAAAPASSVAANISLLFADAFFAQRESLLGDDALTNPTVAYRAIAAALPELNTDAARGLAAEAAPPPLPGLGFCFSPAVSEGPCAVLRRGMASRRGTARSMTTRLLKKTTCRRSPSWNP
jgi:hypothetical protein